MGNKKRKIRDDLLTKLKDIDDKLMGDDDDSKSMEEIQNALNEFDNKRKNKTFRVEVFKKQIKAKEIQLKSLKKDLKSKRLQLKKFEKEVVSAKKILDDCDE